MKGANPPHPGVGTIAALRGRIDAADDALIAALAERAAAVEELWMFKQEGGIPVFDLAREEAVFARVRAQASERGLDPDAVEAIFRRVVGARLRR